MNLNANPTLHSLNMLSSYMWLVLVHWVLFGIFMCMNMTSIIPWFCVVKMLCICLFFHMKTRPTSWKAFLFKFSAVEIKPRASQMLDKCSSTEIHYNIYDYFWLYGTSLYIAGHTCFWKVWDTQKANRSWMWLTCVCMCKILSYRFHLFCTFKM